MVPVHPSPNNWQEARRWLAFELKAQGHSQREIAAVLQVSEAAVSKWMKAVRDQGEVGLHARPRPGAPPRLTALELRQVPEFLSQGAETYGFKGQVWTCARVAKVIGQEFGMTYHPAHVSRLLKHVKWTPQKPIERANQRDETKITAWRQEVWGELKKKARLEHRTLVFVDESGFYLLPAIVRTYAPCGITPVLRVYLTRDHLSTMSAITMAGDLLTLTRTTTMTSIESMHFLKHLQQQLGPRLLVIWDGSPIHRGAPVKEFLAGGGAKQVHLEALPGYAPDLNPTEGVWELLKDVEMRNLCCSDFGHLHSELDLAIRRLRRKPDLIQACFAGAGLTL